MAFSITPTESDVFKALGDFIVTVTGMDTNQAQQNRVPTPLPDDYVMMNTVRSSRLGTNVVTYNSVDQTKTIKQTSELVIQVNIHGPGAANAAGLVSTLFRDSFATEFFAATPDISPLFSEDPRQAPFNNDQQQIEDDWTIDIHLQVNLSTTTPQQSASTLGLDIINVDTDPASWPNSTISVTADS